MEDTAILGYRKDGSEVTCTYALHDNIYNWPDEIELFTKDGEALFLYCQNLIKSGDVAAPPNSIFTVLIH